MPSDPKLRSRFSAETNVTDDGSWTFDPNPTFDEVEFRTEWKAHKDAAFWKYREEWLEIPKNRIEREHPIHLDIETTTHCNLACPMCPRTVQLAKGTFDGTLMMSREEYQRIIDQGAEMGVSSVKLQYLGEPLLHKDVYWQVAYAKSKGIVDVTFNTNGQALTPENSRKLLEAGVDGVFLSQDSVSPRDYAEQRPGGSLGRIIDNYYRFIELRDQIRPSCRVRVSMVMYDDPKWRRQYEALKTMWEGVCDAVGYSYYVERDRNVNGDYPEIPGFFCGQLYQRMFLKADGRATVCCFDDLNQLTVGNWKTQALSDIWNGEKYRTYRKTHAEGNYYSMAPCRKCYEPLTAKPKAKQG